MYKTLLILKYLRKRRIAWVSLIAVMLCTAMVLAIISVMGGWLSMFRASFHGLAGDIVVDGQSITGFPHYQEMLERLEALPEVKAAAPVIRSYGLANIANQLRKPVEVVGYPPDIGQVNGFPDSLHKLKGAPKLTFDLWPDIAYPTPGKYKGDVRSWRGIIVGSGVIGLKKDKHGEIQRGDFIYRSYVDLHVLPLDPDSAVISPDEKGTRTPYWIIDDSRTKVHIYDSNSVYVPFDQLQKDLKMDGADGRPARTSDIQIALKAGVNPYQAKPKVRAIVNAVRWEHISPEVRAAEQQQLRQQARQRAQQEGLGAPQEEALFQELSEDYLNAISRAPLVVQTWEEVNATFIGAIENEKGLVTILFGIVSLVAVFLIFCIFYMIVVEKTKDIGIVKSIGATSSGVAGIFLGYGLAIGIVGSGLGWLVGYLIVHNINELHTWLGRFGIVVWNPEVYLFDTIPNTMNPPEVAVIITVAIISSVLGALVPAIRAARMHPVEALRWE